MAEIGNLQDSTPAESTSRQLCHRSIKLSSEKMYVRMTVREDLRPAHTKRQRQRQDFEWNFADAWCE